MSFKDDYKPTLALLHDAFEFLCHTAGERGLTITRDQLAERVVKAYMSGLDPDRIKERLIDELSAPGGVDDENAKIEPQHE